MVHQPHQSSHASIDSNPFDEKVARSHLVVVVVCSRELGVVEDQLLASALLLLLSAEEL